MTACHPTYLLVGSTNLIVGRYPTHLFVAQPNCLLAHSYRPPSLTPPAPLVMNSAQVYAYTTSPVQVAILELFCRNDCVLPNLFVGTLTRDSVTKALGSGITAEEIVAYLRAHAHPHVARRVPTVPEVRTGYLCMTPPPSLWNGERLWMQTRAWPGVC